MPKAKWGGNLTADDIDGADRGETRKNYSGPLPTAGTYRFVIQSMKQGTSGAGNDKVTIFSTLDGSWKPNHKKYDGCPLWDHLPIMDSTKGRVGNFLDAIGATGKDLFGAIVDDDGKITKLGRVGDPNGLIVYINIKKKPAEGGYDEGIQTGFNAYNPVDDEDDDSDDSAEDGADDDGDEPPF
jgi:hypothetical protein